MAVLARCGGSRSGGCSFSYQLDNLFAKKDEAMATAGALRLDPAKRNDEPPAEADLAIARAAISEVLTKGGKDASTPWENPRPARAAR